MPVYNGVQPGLVTVRMGVDDLRALQQGLAAQAAAAGDHGDALGQTLAEAMGGLFQVAEMSARMMAGEGAAGAGGAEKGNATDGGVVDHG